MDREDIRRRILSPEEQAYHNLTLTDKEVLNNGHLRPIEIEDDNIIIDEDVCLICCYYPCECPHRSFENLMKK